MSPKIVAIAGFTGRFAGLLVEELLQRSDVAIHGLARRPENIPESVSSNPRVKVFKAEASDAEALRAGLRGADIAICCYLGPANVMTEGQKTLIDACIAENVARYMASDWCFDYRKIAYGDHPEKDPMKHTAEYLETKEAEGKIKAIHVLNGCFLEVQLYPGVALDYNSWTMSYWGTGDEKWELTTYRDAAAFSAEVANDDHAHGFFMIRGDFIGAKGMAEELEAVYGKTPKLNSQGSLDEAFALGKKNLQENPSNKWGWLQHLYTYYCLNGHTYMPENELANDKYPSIQWTTYRKYLEATPLEQLKGAGRRQASKRA